MHAYRVIGRGFHVGAGALLLLSTAQAVDRVHKLEPLPGGGRVAEGFGLARAKEAQAFKAGELLGLAELPKGQLELVEDVVPPKGKRERGDPAVLLLDAVRSYQEQADRAEQQRADALARAEAVRLEEEKTRAMEAQQQAWMEEYATNEAIRTKYPKQADYLAARQKEAAEAQG